MQLIRTFVLMLGLLGGLAYPTWAKECVDAERVLAIDFSKSINEREFALQMEGYAAALSDPETVDTILSGPCGAVAFTAFLWGGSILQVTEWTLVHDQASAQAFGEQLGNFVYRVVMQTHIIKALQYGMGLFEESPYPSSCRAILISGDGADNSEVPIGLSSESVRQSAREKKIAINGLPIMIESNSQQVPPGVIGATPAWSYGLSLDRYYKYYIIGDIEQGSFLQPIWRWEDIATALRQTTCQWLLA